MRSDSVIIPCYQDEVKLMHLPKQLHQLPHHPAEIIVVDGADNKKCREICNQYHVLWLSSESCRGQQLLAGVALAQGDVLELLHADARLPPDPLPVMTAAFEQDAVGVIYVFALTPRALGQRLFWSPRLSYGVVLVVFLMEIKVYLSYGRLISRLEVTLSGPYTRKHL